MIDAWSVPANSHDALLAYRQAMTQDAFVSLGHHAPQTAREALEERDAGIAYAAAQPWGVDRLSLS